MMTDSTKSNRTPAFIDPHLSHRKAQEKEHFSRRGDDHPMSSLLTIELNITELCNRVCAFCPRVDPEVYPNRNLNMDMSLVNRLADEVARLGLTCRFSFSGFGEPLLHKGFNEIVRNIRKRCPDNTIEINTNGDRLTAARITELFEAGLTYLYINLYDGPEQRPHFEALVAEAKVPEGRWKLRPHWVGAGEDFALTLNNRSGVLVAPEAGVGPLSQALEMRCHYPFYKMLLDWNGDMLFCSNDWGRKIVVGNLNEKSLDELWLAPRMLEVRRKLLHGARDFAPCDKCSVHGTLSGEPSFKCLIRHYVAEGSIAADELPGDLRNDHD
jgi:radical SAM protein with 4Fe4S-binding SPASM domain